LRGEVDSIRFAMKSARTSLTLFTPVLSCHRFDRALATSFQSVRENCLSARWGLSASLLYYGLRGCGKTLRV
jgi:hypothetical protein